MVNTKGSPSFFPSYEETACSGLTVCSLCQAILNPPSLLWVTDVCPIIHQRCRLPRIDEVHTFVSFFWHDFLKELGIPYVCMFGVIAVVLKRGFGGENL